MEITDQYILNTFWSNKVLHLNKKEYTDEVNNYLLNRFNDSDSIKETIYRIKYKIENRPKCFTCNGKVKFYGKPNYIFGKYCCKECKHNGEVGKLMKQTKLKKYNNENFVNSQKAKETCLKKYGLENVLLLKENKEKAKINSKLPEVIDRIKKTNLERYGVENPWHQEHIKNKAKINSHTKEAIEKIKLNWKNKSQNELNKIKSKKQFFYESLSDDQLKSILEKRKKTNNERYHCDFLTQTNEFKQKAKNTWLLKYGVDNPMKNKDIVEKVSKILKTDEVRIKTYKTKLKNNTLGGPKSLMEDKSYELLKEKYSDVIRQYMDPIRYPYNCDFYIPSLDLFIECQYYPAHGPHPFDENNENDKQYSEYLKYTKFNNIIWTIKDVNKRNIAKYNKLNYLEFFNINDLKKWLNK